MLTNTEMLNTPMSQRQQGIEDERPTLNRFRRSGLYIILRHNGHDNIDENMPHTEMLAYALAHEKELTDEGLVITPSDYGGFKVAKPREVTAHEKQLDKEVQVKREEYGEEVEGKWDELRAEAAERGIDITRMKYEEVVAVLVDAKKDIASGYETLSWPDLKKLAKERGIESYGKKKPEIIAALKGE